MAKALKGKDTTSTITKEKAKPVSPQILLQQLILRNVDRTPKNVGDWRLAHRMAEAVINPSRKRLYDLFKDVELDGHLSGLWKKRVTGVVNKKLYFSRNGVKDESFEPLLRSKKFRQLRKLMMSIHSHGIVGIEFIPGAEFDFAEIPRKHIKPHLKRITFEEDGEKGVDYETMPNLWVIEGDEPFGFMLKASPYALFKKGNYSDWAQYVEIFGQPVIITKYDGYDEKTRQLLDQALTSAGSSLRLMLPKQAEFEMLDGKTSNGDGKLQETFKNSLNNELSVLVLGNTETTSNENGGSYAKGKVHAGQQLEITKDDMEEELMLMNDPMMMQALKMYGYNTDGVDVLYETEVDSAELKTSLEIDEKLEKAGVPLGHDYYYETYHRPKPKDYDKLMADKKSRQVIPGNPEKEDPAETEEPDDNTPDNTGNKKVPAKKKEPPKNLTAALKGLSFWEKVKVLFP